MQVPTEDRYLLRKTELLNRIATLLGGRAAEEIIFGDISTGAQNDLSRATDMAKSMVKEYGMSDKAGQVYFAHDRRSEFLGYGMSESPDYSEATSEMIDSEISQIISTQHQRALEILQIRYEATTNCWFETLDLVWDTIQRTTRTWTPNKIRRLCQIT